jgi:hypothetical protein
MKSKLNKEVFAPGTTPTFLEYVNLRNISSQEMKDSNVQVFVGLFYSNQLLKIEDDENVRRFIGNPEKNTGRVQKDIAGTIEDNPENFALLNGGITIVCDTAEVHNDKNQIRVINSSIVNGSQTRGVLKNHHNNENAKSVAVKVEIIVTNGNKDLVADISISRNVQTKVKDMSIFGRKGAWLPVNKSLEGTEYKVVEDESDTDGISPNLVIQCLFLLMPKELWEKNLPDIIYNKASLYSNSGKFLRAYFEEIFEKKSGEGKELMNFVKDLTSEALDLYFYLQSAQEFKFIRTSGRNGLTKDDSGDIKKVANGWIFPVIAGYSLFVKKESGKWIIDLPEDFKVRGLIKMVKRFYDQDINKLGKTKDAYVEPEFQIKSGMSTSAADLNI